MGREYRIVVSVPEFSQSGTKVLFTAIRKEDQKGVVVLNGQEICEAPPGQFFIGGSPKMNHDGNVWAVLRAEGQPERALGDAFVVNGQTYGPFGALSQWPVSFSATGKRFAFWMTKDVHRGPMVLVVDGQSSEFPVCPEFGCDDVFCVHFDNLGEHYATVAPMETDGAAIVIDGKKAFTFEGVYGFKSSFGLNGMKLVTGGDAAEPGLMLSTLSLSPDGRHVAYWVRSAKSAKESAGGSEDSKGWFVSLDDKKISRTYDRVFPSAPQFRPCFSPDGKRLAWIGTPKEGEGIVVVTDNGETDAYENIFGLAFSPDSAHVAYSARLKGKWAVFQDGTSIHDNLDSISTVAFSPDSELIAWTGEAGNKKIAGIGGRTSDPYDEIVSPPSFPEPNHLVLVARNGSSILRVERRFTKPLK
jgi:hypothetical protein